MTAAELDELERLVTDMYGPEADMELVVCAEAELVAKYLPALIAKVRAAEELADVALAHDCDNDSPLFYAADAYRKAGQP